MQKRSGRSREDAEGIGLSALVFLTEDGERLGRFLAETGLAPKELGAAAGSPETLVAVLDHLLADESLLMVFVAGAGFDPAAIGPARDVLAGTEMPKDQDGSVHSVQAPGRKPSRRWPGL